LRITDESRSVLPDKHLRVNVTKSLQIPVRLAPSVFVYHIGERYAADWSKPAHADPQQSGRVPVRRQSERALRCLANCK
jgi:hypothetical protein